MKRVEKTATATTERGTALFLRVVAERGWEIIDTTAWVDEVVEIRKAEVINNTTMTITANGKAYKGYFQTEPPASAGVDVIFYADGGAIGMTTAVYNTLNAAVEAAEREAEEDEGWKRLMANRRETERVEAEYRKHYNTVRNAMN